MILQSLVDFYEALAAEGKISKSGWSKVKVSFALVLSLKGELISVSDIRMEEEKGKKKVTVPQELSLPSPVKRANAINPNLLWDNVSYLLGADEKGKPDRAQKCFEASGERHRELLKDIDDDMARAVLFFFDHWNPQQAPDHPALREYWKEMNEGANLTFRVDGRYLTESPAICKAWDDYYGQSEGETGFCLVTGKYGTVARLHPSVKGIAGAQSSGASLVSFNAPAYCSYEKDQGANSPVSEYAAFAYTSALNYLIADIGHKETLGDTTILYWCMEKVTAYQDLFSMMWRGEQEGMDQKQLTSVMNAIAGGHAVEWENVMIQPDDRFYILGLSPNAARLSVRFFLISTFGRIVRNLQKHYENISVAHGPKEKDHLSLWRLTSETVNQNSKDKKPAPQLSGDLARAVLEGRPYPATLYDGVQLRIRADRKVTYGRAAVIKAYLTERPEGIDKEVLTVSLNEESKYKPYVLGRLFSVLEGLQNAANPGINATIRDRYFNSACATPAVVFPMLLKLAQNHLKKLSAGMKVYYEKQITELMSRIDMEFPDRLSLKEQGTFQLGYYNQTQARYEKKNGEDEEE